MSNLAYSYIRWSSLSQSKGDSLTRQTRQRNEFIKRKNLVLDTRFALTDLGVSAFRGKNVRDGALAGFLEAIKLGKIPTGSTLIVESLDRLSRDQIGEALSLFISILNSGVQIATLTPEKIYTKESINNIADLLEPIIVMQRAHEESATKSSRGRSAWDGKRKAITEKKLTGRIPGWLEISEDQRSFIEVPAKVKAVQRIFALALDGLGINGITKKLNAEKVPAIGRSNSWQKSYVTKILGNRSVFGEFQPHSLVEGKRKPQGEPVPNYFPVIISEDNFYKAQTGLASRRTQRGPTGREVKNLFTGILVSGFDRCSMNLVDKGLKSRGSRLVSSGAIRGVEGSPYQSIHYSTFEATFLQFVKELKASDFTVTTVGEDREAALLGRLENLESKIARIKARMESEEDIDSLIDLVKKFEGQKKSTKSELEQVKQQKSNLESENLNEVKSLAELLESAKDSEDRTALRTRIKARIRQLIKLIVVDIIPSESKASDYQIFVVVKFDAKKLRFFASDQSGRLLGNGVFPDQVQEVVKVLDLEFPGTANFFELKKLQRDFDRMQALLIDPNANLGEIMKLASKTYK